MVIRFKRIQRACLVILISAVLVLTLHGAAHAQGVVSITPPDGSFPANSDFTLEVHLDSADATNIAGVSVFLTYDQALISFVSGLTNTAAWDNSLLTNHPREQEPGVISFPAFANNPVTGNNVLVATLNFHSVSAAGGPGNLSFMDQIPRLSELTDVDFVHLPGLFQPAAVTITDPVGTPTPTSTATPSSTMTSTPVGTPDPPHEYLINGSMDFQGQSNGWVPPGWTKFGSSAVDLWWGEDYGGASCSLNSSGIRVIRNDPNWNGGLYYRFQVPVTGWYKYTGYCFGENAVQGQLGYAVGTSTVNDTNISNWADQTVCEQYEAWISLTMGQHLCVAFRTVESSGGWLKHAEFGLLSVLGPDPNATATPLNTATNTPVNTATNTAVSTNTPADTLTMTPVNTHTPVDTATNTPNNTATDTPADTATNTPADTPTEAPNPWVSGWEGDANGDDLVNSSDYFVVKGTLGNDHTCQTACRGTGDANGSGGVSTTDYFSVKNNLGQSYDAFPCTIVPAPCN